MDENPYKAPVEICPPANATFCRWRWIAVGLLAPLVVATTALSLAGSSVAIVVLAISSISLFALLIVEDLADAA